MQEKKHNTLEDWAGRIRVSPELEKQGRAMYNDIHTEVNHRIDRMMKKDHRRKIWTIGIAIAASVSLLLAFTGYYSYQKGYEHLNSLMVEMDNPLGMKSTITLADGTRVILNAGTTLTYPTAFTGKERNVEVSGEAFFFVANNPKHPFKVKADKIEVEVLGTEFNVKAYTDDQFIEVTLTGGSIKAGPTDKKGWMKMEPGQLLRYDKHSELLSREQVDLLYYTSWIDGKFYFSSLPLKEIARRLERTFNVKIDIISDKLKETVFSGDFVRGENLDQILRVMSLNHSIYYIIEGDEVKIYEQ